MTDHTAALREALEACERNLPHIEGMTAHSLLKIVRAALAQPQQPAGWQENTDEAAEILCDLIANIEKDGLYSQEAVLTFLSQALSCLNPANPAHPSKQEDDERYEALRRCALKYLAWLNVSNPEKALESDLTDPEMIGDDLNSAGEGGKNG